jgi:hypothetical protein
MSNNANVKLTAGGPTKDGSYYACLDLRSDENTINIEGGTLVMDGVGKKNVLNVSGKNNKYNVAEGYTTFVGGNDAASASDKTALSTSDKYISIVYNAVPTTSDVSYVAVATAAVIAVLAGAAVVILRKKSENN